ncbi:MAG TPA: cytochrome c oxidase subunit II [Oligoflexus sp.]|uniref:cytochrome c oxidase subunit II n=1 Tax=Oligoflexus sp. TaxID=1971216 RepID=UPI002D7E36E9|nr:cytochrome c oxidase subunit II [Oligoflexus sp.]HET9240134.1 cytochrome c oxidase subunit II [Oligoflexus sp.]
MEFLKWPQQASAFAADVDHVFIVLLIVSGGAVLLIAGLIVFFCVRYSRKKQPRPVHHTNTKLSLEIGWSVIALAFFLFAFAWGARIYLQMYRTAPDDAYAVYAIGKQWMWKFQHPDGRREINELHVPVNRPVKINLISQDVIHSLYIPAFRLKHDVLPMAYTEMWFEPTLPGSYHLFCAEYCGTSHSEMVGQVIAMRPEDFENWLGNSQGMGSTAQQGAKLVASLGCTSCHKSESTSIAPWFGGIYGKPVELADGTSTVVNDAYIRESILNPQAKVVRNFQPAMPSYQGRITEDEILSITAYIKSLREQKNE